MPNLAEMAGRRQAEKMEENQERLSLIFLEAQAKEVTSTTGPTAWRFGTWEVKEGNLNRQQVGDEVLWGLDFYNLLD